MILRFSFLFLSIAYCHAEPSSCTALLTWAAALGSRTSSSPFYSNSLTIIIPYEAAANVTSWLLSWENRGSSVSLTDFVFGSPNAYSVYLALFPDASNSSRMYQAVGVKGGTPIQSGNPLTFTWIGRKGDEGSAIPPNEVQFQTAKCGVMQQSSESDGISCIPDPSSCSLSRVYCCISDDGNLSSAYSDDWLSSWQSTFIRARPSPLDGSIGTQVGIGLGASLGFIATLVVIVILMKKRARQGARRKSHHLVTHHVTSGGLAHHSVTHVTSGGLAHHLVTHQGTSLQSDHQKRRSGFRGDSCCEAGVKESDTLRPQSTLAPLASMLTRAIRRLSTCYFASVADQSIRSINIAEGDRSSNPLRRCHSCPGLYSSELRPTMLNHVAIIGSSRQHPSPSRSFSIMTHPPHPLLLQRHINQSPMHDELKAQLLKPMTIDFSVDYEGEIEPHLGRLLGVGGFGRVYQGIWRSMAVAVKVCEIEQAEDVLAEAKLNAQVAGDRMVCVLGERC